MPIAFDDRVKILIGDLVIQIAKLQVESDTLKEQLPRPAAEKAKKS